MTVIGIDADGSLVCQEGNAIYNCGETLEQFGNHNLTVAERITLTGQRGDDE